MSRIDAINRGGVFEPLGPVNLSEEQRVQLSFEPANWESPQAWLNRVKPMQAVIVQRQGFLPESAPDIAADRKR
jgi:hypothetical protein